MLAKKKSSKAKRKKKAVEQRGRKRVGRRIHRYLGGEEK